MPKSKTEEAPPDAPTRHRPRQPIPATGSVYGKRTAAALKKPDDGSKTPRAQPAKGRQAVRAQPAPPGTPTTPGELQLALTKITERLDRLEGLAQAHGDDDSHTAEQLPELADRMKVMEGKLIGLGEKIADIIATVEAVEEEVEE